MRQNSRQSPEITLPYWPSVKAHERYVESNIIETDPRDAGGPFNSRQSKWEIAASRNLTALKNEKKF
ncbi:MAG: hypothetical protein WCF22_24970 [Candidatus Sulfotelmatobacter sp.]